MPQIMLDGDDRAPERSRTWRRRWRVSIALATAVSLAGCATVEVTQITLSGVVRGGKAVVDGPVPAEAVQLERNGAAYQVEPSMTMQPGDALSTGPDTAAVVSYPGGARAYVYPSTRVRIGSLIDEIGKVFIKAKGAFTVKTTFVTAGSEGTQYWVDVKERDQVRVVVVEDAVRLSSNVSAWPAQRLQAGQQAFASGGAPAATSAADPLEIARERDWVSSMDRLVPVQTAANPWAVGAAVILVPIILHQILNRGDKESPRGPRTDPTQPYPPRSPTPERVPSSPVRPPAGSQQPSTDTIIK